jgi:hypothetical protein
MECSCPDARRRILVALALVYTIGEHVLNGEGDGRHSVYAVHERNLALLLMTNRVCHDLQARVAPMAQFGIRHRDRSFMMPGHEINEETIEG